MKVKLDGKSYNLRGVVSRSTVEEWLPQVRFTGEQKRIDRGHISHWATTELRGGFGSEVFTEGQRDKFWDSEIDTRRNPYCLPADPQTPTAVTGKFVAACGFGGTYYALYYTADKVALAYWDSGEWKAKSDIATTLTTPVAHALVVHKSKLYAFFSTSAGQFFRWSSSADASSWSGLAYVYSAKYITETKTVRVCDAGSRLFVLWINETDSNLELSDTVDAGANWTHNEVTTILDEPTGLVIFWDEDGAEKPFVASKNSLWMTAADGTSPVKKLDFSAFPYTNNCRDMCIWNNFLILPLGEGCIKYTNLGQVTLFGMDLYDGVPDEKRGEIASMFVVGEWLYAAVGGQAAARKACVFAYRGLGWHFMWKYATADKDILFIGGESTDDGVPRLHIIGEIGTTTNEFYRYLKYPFENPKRQSLYEFDTGKELTLPRFDGEMEEEETSFYEALVGADLTDDERIELFYGLDGDSPVQFQGVFVDEAKKLKFGKKGIAATRMQPKLKFVRGATTTKSPWLRAFIVRYEKMPDRRREFRFEVDLSTSALGHRTPESVRAELDELAANKTLIEFKYGKQSVYVRLAAVTDSLFADPDKGAVGAVMVHAREPVA